MIPNSYQFCIMGRDHGNGKPMSWSKNQFLLDEGVLIFLVLILNKHNYGVFDKFSDRFSETNILYMIFLLCLNSVSS